MSTLPRISPPPFPDVRLRSPPNWTVICFLALLGGVHLVIALTSFVQGRWEGYMSLIFAAAFLLAAGFGGSFRREIRLQASRGRIRLRNGIGPWHAVRFIPFADVLAVKLTLPGQSADTASITLLCPAEELECPPTAVPRQQALLLALLLGVRLIKIGDGDDLRHPTESEASQRA